MKRKFDYQKIVEYYNYHTISETAKHFGCSSDTIRVACKSSNITVRKSLRTKINRETIIELFNKGMTDKEIAAQLEVHPITIAVIREKELHIFRKPWLRNTIKSKLDGAKLYAEYLLGKSYEDLCNKHQRNINEIQTAIGFHLMELCRKDKNCPVKALLPEFDSSKL